MSSNFISGLVSGIDSASLIDALVAARARPIRLLEQRQAEKTAQLSAWKSFEAILVSLKVETDRLGASSLWETLNVVSSDEEVLTATASAGAALGTYDLFVSQLAQAHQIRSVQYTGKDDLVGSGTLAITVGSTTTNLTVAAGSSLEDLAEQINGADAGVSAAIVRSESGGTESFHLVLTADKTGSASSISVTSSLTGGTDPVFTDQVRPAQDARILFGGESGFAVDSATNVFEDLVDGVDVTVHQVMQTGETLTLRTERDTQGLESAVSTFVDRYNSMITFVNEQFRFDPEIGVRPPLMGNATLTSIAGDLRALATRALGGGEGAAFRTLFSIGVTSTDTGTLSFDAAEFRDALDQDFDAVANLFRANASFDLDGIRLLSTPDDVDLGERTVTIVVSQAAARAEITGDLFALGSGITIDSTNDTFRISIDGVLSEELSVAHGTYTDGDSLAAAIAQAVDDSDDLGALGVRVAYEDAGSGTGNLVITSNRYGSAGMIRLQNTSSSFASTVGLSTQFNLTYAGADVLGTIDGVAAEGNGRTLVAGDDLADISGLSFLVTLEDTDVPATITATFTEGAGRTLSRRLESLTDASEGTLARVGSSIQGLLDALSKDIQNKTDQLDVHRAMLEKRYARLESMLGQLQNQGLFVSAQMQAMRSGGTGFNTLR